MKAYTSICLFISHPLTFSRIISITDEKISVVCGHSFCADCLTALLARDTSCPQCRKDITHKGFVDLRDFLKRFNPDAWNEMESEEAEVRDLAAKAPVGDAVAAMLADGVGYAGGRSKGKGKAQDCQMPQLKQIYADVIQFDGNFVPSTKLHRCLEIISETCKERQEEEKRIITHGLCSFPALNHPGEKIIIFSQFASFLDVLQTPLKARGIEHERYDGKMSRMARVRAIDRFRSDPHCYVILVSLKCGSLGLNLTAANHVVLCDLWWNPAVENQAIDRAHRIGQVRRGG